MLKNLLHRIVAVPFVYEAVQVFFGANKKRRAVIRYLDTLTDYSTILDLGGGTGFYRKVWPKSFRYICLDNDWVKLEGFLQQHPQDLALMADASRIPIRDASLDVVFCNSMAHHIPSQVLEVLIADSARVLKNSGRIFFLDAVLDQQCPLNRLLWKLDRGEYPHTHEELKILLEKNFKIEQFDRFDNLYNYVFFIGSKKAV